MKKKKNKISFHTVVQYSLRAPILFQIHTELKSNSY